MEESDKDYDDLYFRELGKYLAINLTLEDNAGSNLIPAIPNRVETMNVPAGGHKPGMAYLDSDYVDKE